jgi:hypothetical protein
MEPTIRDSGRCRAKPGSAATKPTASVATIDGVMADQTPTVPLDQQLQEIGAQLAWVRDYL